MEIHIDYNPTPKDHFFISVPLNNKEYISFDKTIKGMRIIKQVFIEERPFPEDANFDSEWETIIIKDGKFNNKFHVKWIDLNKDDWLNGEIWETVSEKPIDNKLSEDLLKYSQLVSDHYNELDNYREQIAKFEDLLKSQITRF